jgi:hypothetical protein
MNDFLSFRKMITPIVIQVVFWIGVVLCVIGGLVGIIAGAVSHDGGGQQVLAGLITLLLGPLFVRIYCEVLMVFFKMNDSLTEIRNNTAKPPL